MSKIALSWNPIKLFWLQICSNLLLAEQKHNIHTLKIQPVNQYVFLSTCSITNSTKNTLIIY